MITPSVIAREEMSLTLENWLQNPPKRQEWVDGKLSEKNGMTAKHGKVQARLAAYWINYKKASQQGGEVYTETPCRTIARGRCPDVAYLTAELVAQSGDFTALPQSFPLIAEVISPTDSAEEIFSKANEYLQSGCQEIWLILPESQWIIVITEQERLLFAQGDVVTTQKVLKGFSVDINELLA